MPVTYHVFGACVPFVGVGSGGALVSLGNCRDGGDIAELFDHEPKKMDGAGNKPADYQAMGTEAEIVFALGSYDPAVFQTVRLRSQANGNLGAFLAAGGYTFPLYLPSSTDDPWFFPCCFLLGPKHAPAMKSDDLTVRFKAFRPLGPTGTTTYGTDLYRRATS